MRKLTAKHAEYAKRIPFPFGFQESPLGLASPINQEKQYCPATHPTNKFRVPQMRRAPLGLSANDPRTARACLFPTPPRHHKEIWGGHRDTRPRNPTRMGA